MQSPRDRWLSMVRVVEGRHSATVMAFRWFKFDHLPAHLSVVSEDFAVLALQLVDRLPDDPALTTALNKVREAKDWAVGLAAWVADNQ